MTDEDLDETGPHSAVRVELRSLGEPYASEMAELMEAESGR